MTDTSRRLVLAGLAAGVLSPLTAVQLRADARPKMTTYASPYCGCCSLWVEHMIEHGFDVETVYVTDLDPVKSRYGVHPYLQSCHTATVGGYVIEGHVPAQEVHRLLKLQPDAIGLAVRGMPIGSPGMEQGDTREPFDVVLFNETNGRVFARF